MYIRLTLFILLSIFSHKNLFSQVPYDYLVPPIDVAAEQKAAEERQKELVRIEQIQRKKITTFNKKYKTNYTLIDNDLGDYWVLSKGEKKGLIEVKSGRTIIPFIFSYISFHLAKQTFVASQQDNSCALYDLKGTELIPLQTGQYFNTFENDTTNYFFRVSDSISSIKGGYGPIINYKGQIVAKRGFDYVKVTHQKYLLTEKNNLWGLVDSLGHVIFDNQFTELNQIGLYKATPWKRLDTIFVAKRPDNKVGLVSLSGKILMPFDFTYINYAGCNLIGTMRGNYANANAECGFYDLNFKLFIPFSENQVHTQCEEGLIIYGRGSYGFMDSLGKAKIPVEYEVVRAFQNGLAVVVKKGKCGIIDTNNRIILPFMYDGLGFFNGFLFVKLGKKCGVMDLNYRILLPIEFDDVHFPTGFDGVKYFEVEQGEACFKYNVQGEKVGACEK